MINRDDMRALFNDHLTYADVARTSLEVLHGFLKLELATSHMLRRTLRCDDYMQTRFADGLLQEALITCSADYFSARECVRFDSDGFIGFYEWAGTTNVQPILTGFKKWCDWMIARTPTPHQEEVKDGSNAKKGDAKKNVDTHGDS